MSGKSTIQQSRICIKNSRITILCEIVRTGWGCPWHQSAVQIKQHSRRRAWKPKWRWHGGGCRRFFLPWCPLDGHLLVKWESNQYQSQEGTRNCNNQNNTYLVSLQIYSLLLGSVGFLHCQRWWNWSGFWVVSHQLQNCGKSVRKWSQLQPHPSDNDRFKMEGMMLSHHCLYSPCSMPPLFFLLWRKDLNYSNQNQSVRLHYYHVFKLEK